MGRRKLPMEYIQNEKARNTTFEKRKNGLKKKAHELATLCDVSICMIIYQGPNSVPETVPANREEAVSIINRYTSIPKEESAKRSLNLETLLLHTNNTNNKRKRSFDNHPQQLSTNANANVPDASWLPVLDGCTKEELSSLANILHEKMQAVEKRIQTMRASFNGGGNVFMGGPEFYHPHGQHGQYGQYGQGGGVGGSGIMDAAYCTESYHGGGNVFMGGPDQFYHPHGQHGQHGQGGGVGGSGIMDAYCTDQSYHEMQMQMQMAMGGHMYCYNNC